MSFDLVVSFTYESHLAAPRTATRFTTYLPSGSLPEDVIGSDLQTLHIHWQHPYEYGFFFHPDFELKEKDGLSPTSGVCDRKHTGGNADCGIKW